MERRTVITGMGLVSCFGQDVGHFYETLLAGTSGVETIQNFDTSDYSTKFAAAVKNFESGDYIDKKQARRVDRAIAYSLVAGKKALEMAGLYPELQSLDRSRSGVLIGTGIGGMNVYFEGIKNLLEKGPRRLTPFFIPYIITNMPGALLAIDLGFMGPCYSISTACATSNYSIISAAAHIRNGDADLMVTGGVEAAVSPVGLAGFIACKALSQRNDEPKKASRPWDKARDGFVLGEGAAVLILESLEHAKKRNAPILAEYLGGGISCDAYHMTEPRPDGEGVVACLHNALKDAKVSADSINYINAHATSTPLGDLAEIRALKKVFQNPSTIKMNATKSMIGHSLGAAGAFEAIATIMAMKTGKIHPTINLTDPEPDLGFDIPCEAENHTIKVAVSNSFGFGGHNASIVLSPWKE